MRAPPKVRAVHKEMVMGVMGEKVFETKEVLEIRRDGELFARFTAEYAGMDMADVVELEDERMNAMQAWLARAKAKVSA